MERSFESWDAIFSFSFREDPSVYPVLKEVNKGSPEAPVLSVQRIKPARITA